MTLKLIEAEERETGSVSGKVYWAYTVASGGLLFVGMYVCIDSDRSRGAGAVAKTCSRLAPAWKRHAYTQVYIRGRVRAARSSPT